MELLLAIAALAGFWWVFRVVRGRQRRGVLSNMPPRTYGDLMLTGYDPTESRAVENYVEQVDDDGRPPGFRLGDS
ncbi:hypothetical protein IU501_02285 [Nocardia otitidiscaviarum]|uniref:hypothetical protein n=1 Tax=Nocardia otitidiscaviarum TaxID=1823 RepID=UPI0011DDFD9A|nr:hypothetical protein [Nocardia otitidiscaviarum]MBF6131833.1 hypothetical protein [Nocardia otitidiscaviarum]MBF6482964.1 hypothetical protein [Nocardia otitidiscaviarum]